MNSTYKHIATLYIIIGLLLFGLFIQNNKIISSNKTIEVNIPAKDGTFVKTKPSEIKYDTIIKDTIIFKDKKIIIDNTDKIIVQNYLLAKDSIEKLNILLNAAKIRKYQEKFDNEDITLTIDAETTGTINWIKPSYIIKERKIDVPVIDKKTVFALYAGGKISNNLNLNSPNIESNIGIQNKKGNILFIGYDTQHNISLGYSFRIINIKK